MSVSATTRRVRLFFMLFGRGMPVELHGFDPGGRGCESRRADARSSAAERRVSPTLVLDHFLLFCSFAEECRRDYIGRRFESGLARASRPVAQRLEQMRIGNGAQYVSSPSSSACSRSSRRMPAGLHGQPGSNPGAARKCSGCLANSRRRTLPSARISHCTLHPLS